MAVDDSKDETAEKPRCGKRQEKSEKTVTAASCTLNKPEQSSHAKSVAEKSVAEKSVAEKSVAEKSVAEKSVAEKSVTEKSVAEKGKKSLRFFSRSAETVANPEVDHKQPGQRPDRLHARRPTTSRRGYLSEHNCPGSRYPSNKTAQRVSKAIQIRTSKSCTKECEILRSDYGSDYSAAYSALFEDLLRTDDSNTCTGAEEEGVDCEEDEITLSESTVLLMDSEDVDDKSVITITSEDEASPITGNHGAPNESMTCRTSDRTSSRGSLCSVQKYVFDSTSENCLRPGSNISVKEQISVVGEVDGVEAAQARVDQSETKQVWDTHGVGVENVSLLSNSTNMVDMITCDTINVSPTKLKNLVLVEKFDQSAVQKINPLDKTDQSKPLKLNSMGRTDQSSSLKLNSMGRTDQSSSLMLNSMGRTDQSSLEKKVSLKMSGKATVQKVITLEGKEKIPPTFRNSTRPEDDPGNKRQVTFALKEKEEPAVKTPTRRSLISKFLAKTASNSVKAVSNSASEQTKHNGLTEEAHTRGGRQENAIQADGSVVVCDVPLSDAHTHIAHASTSHQKTHTRHPLFEAVQAMESRNGESPIPLSAQTRVEQELTNLVLQITSEHSRSTDERSMNSLSTNRHESSEKLTPFSKSVNSGQSAVTQLTNDKDNTNDYLLKIPSNCDATNLCSDRLRLNIKAQDDRLARTIKETCGRDSPSISILSFNSIKEVAESAMSARRDHNDVYYGDTLLSVYPCCPTASPPTGKDPLSLSISLDRLGGGNLKTECAEVENINVDVRAAFDVPTCSLVSNDTPVVDTTSIQYPSINKTNITEQELAPASSVSPAALSGQGLPSKSSNEICGDEIVIHPLNNPISESSVELISKKDSRESKPTSRLNSSATEGSINVLATPVARTVATSFAKFSLPSQVTHDYLPFLNKLRQDTEKTAKRESIRQQNKINKQQRKQTENVKKVIVPSEDACHGDIESMTSTPTCPIGHEVPPEWRPGEHSSHPLTRISASYTYRYRKMRRRPRVRRNKPQNWILSKAKLCESGSLKANKNVSNVEANANSVDDRYGPAASTIHRYEFSKTDTGDNPGVDIIASNYQQSNNFEHNIGYLEKLSTEKVTEGSVEMCIIDCNPLPKRITSQVRLLKTLDELYSSTSSDDGEGDTYINNSSSLDKNHQISLINYYTTRLRHMSVHENAPPRKSDRALSGIRIRKATQEVPSTLDSKRLKCLYDCRSKKGSLSLQLRKGASADHIPNQTEEIQENVIKSGNQVYLLKGYSRSPSKFQQSAKLTSNRDSAQKICPEVSQRTLLSQSTGDKELTKEPPLPLPSNAQQKSHSDIFKSNIQRLSHDGKHVPGASLSQAGDTNGPRQNSSSSQHAPNETQIPASTEENTWPSDVKGKDSSRRTKLKVRFVDSHNEAVKERAAWEMYEEDTWCSSVNAMLLRANKVMDSSIKNDHRYPKPDSARVVSPVPPKSPTFLKELLKQDTIDRQQAKGQSKHDRRPKEVAYKYEKHDTRPHKTAAQSSTMGQNLNQSVMPRNAQAEAPQAGAKSSLVYTVPMQEGSPNVNVKSAGVLKISIQMSKRAQERAWLTHERLKHQRHLTSDNERSDSKMLPKKLAPLRFPKPINFQNPDTRGHERVSMREIKALAGQGTHVQPCVHPRINHDDSSFSQRSNFLLDHHSETLHYYRVPSLYDRTSSIVPLFGDSNNNAPLENDEGEIIQSKTTTKDSESKTCVDSVPLYDLLKASLVEESIQTMDMSGRLSAEVKESGDDSNTPCRNTAEESSNSWRKIDELSESITDNSGFFTDSLSRDHFMVVDRFHQISSNQTEDNACALQPESRSQHQISSNQTEDNACVLHTESRSQHQVMHKILSTLNKDTIKTHLPIYVPGRHCYLNNVSGRDSSSVIGQPTLDSGLTSSNGKETLLGALLDYEAETASNDAMKNSLSIGDMSPHNGVYADIVGNAYRPNITTCESDAFSRTIYQSKWVPHYMNKEQMDEKTVELTEALEESSGCIDEDTFKIKAVQSKCGSDLDVIDMTCYLQEMCKEKNPGDVPVDNTRHLKQFLPKRRVDLYQGSPRDSDYVRYINNFALHGCSVSLNKKKSFNSLLDVKAPSRFQLDQKGLPVTQKRNQPEPARKVYRPVNKHSETRASKTSTCKLHLLEHTLKQTVSNSLKGTANRRNAFSPINKEREKSRTTDIRSPIKPNKESDLVATKRKESPSAMKQNATDEHRAECSMYEKIFKDFDEEYWSCNTADGRCFSWEKVSVPPSFTRNYVVPAKNNDQDSVTWMEVFSAASNHSIYTTSSMLHEPEINGVVNNQKSGDGKQGSVSPLVVRDTVSDNWDSLCDPPNSLCTTTNVKDTVSSTSTGKDYSINHVSLDVDECQSPLINRRATCEEHMVPTCVNQTEWEQADRVDKTCHIPCIRGEADSLTFVSAEYSRQLDMSSLFSNSFDDVGIDNEDDGINNKDAGNNNEDDDINNEDDDINNEDYDINKEDYDINNEDYDINNEDDDINNEDDGINNEDDGINNEDDDINNEDDDINNEDDDINNEDDDINNEDDDINKYISMASGDDVDTIKSCSGAHEESFLQNKSTEPKVLVSHDSSKNIHQPVFGSLQNSLKQSKSSEQRPVEAKSPKVNSFRVFSPILDRCFLKKLRTTDLLHTLTFNTDRLLKCLQLMVRRKGHLPIFQIKSTAFTDMDPQVVTLNHCAPTYVERCNPPFLGTVRSLPIFYTEDASGFLTSIYTVNWIPEGVYSLEQVDINNITGGNPGDEVCFGRLLQYSPSASDLAFLSDRSYLIGDETATREMALKTLIAGRDEAQGDITKYFMLMCGWVPPNILSPAAKLSEKLSSVNSPHHKECVLQLADTSTGASDLLNSGRKSEHYKGPDVTPECRSRHHKVKTQAIIQDKTLTLPRISDKKSLVVQDGGRSKSLVIPSDVSERNKSRLSLSKCSNANSPDGKSKIMLCLRCGVTIGRHHKQDELDVHSDQPLSSERNLNVITNTEQSKLLKGMYLTPRNGRRFRQDSHDCRLGSRQNPWDSHDCRLGSRQNPWDSHDCRLGSRQNPWDGQDCRHGSGKTVRGLQECQQRWEVSNMGVAYRIPTPFIVKSEIRERTAHGKHEKKVCSDVDSRARALMRRRTRSVTMFPASYAPESPDSKLDNARSQPALDRSTNPRGKSIYEKVIEQAEYSRHNRNKIKSAEREYSMTDFRNNQKVGLYLLKTAVETSNLPVSMGDKPGVMDSFPDIRISQRVVKTKSSVHSNDVNSTTLGASQKQQLAKNPQQQQTKQKTLQTSMSAPQVDKDKARSVDAFVAGWSWGNPRDAADEEKDLLEKRTWTQPVIPPPFPTNPSANPGPTKSHHRLGRNLQLTKAHMAQHKRNLSHINHSYISPYWAKKEVKRPRNKSPASDSGDDRSSLSRITTISGMTSSSSGTNTEDESSTEESQSDSGSSASGVDFFTRYANKGGPTSVDDIFKRTLPKERLEFSLNRVKEAREKEEREELGYLRGREGATPPLMCDQGDNVAKEAERSVTFVPSDYDMCSDADEVKEMWKLCFPEVDFWDTNRRKKFKKRKILF